MRDDLKCIIMLNDESIQVSRGISLAAAIWSTGRRAFTVHPVTGAPQGPFCGMGVCQECRLWIQVDSLDSRGGFEAVRSCLEPVRDGMRVSLVDPLQESG